MHRMRRSRAEAEQSRWRRFRLGAGLRSCAVPNSLIEMVYVPAF